MITCGDCREVVVAQDIDLAVDKLEDILVLDAVEEDKVAVDKLRLVDNLVEDSLVVDNPLRLVENLDLAVDNLVVDSLVGDNQDKPLLGVVLDSIHHLLEVADK